MKHIPKRVWGIGLLVVIYLTIAYLIPRPAAIEAAGWRLFALFSATVAGLIFQPISGGALVLIAIVFSSLVGGLTIKQALDGYSDPTNWLVLAAFLISRSLLNTGLARRIALFFVRLFGKTSLGVSYALCFSDMVLATIIPSNGARSGGVILPIVRGVAELYGSKPGLSAPLIGAFLMTSVYQGICISSAMFLTGQASNPLAAQMATKISGIEFDWFGWFRAGVVPGMISILAVPWLVSKIYKPEIIRSDINGATETIETLTTINGRRSNPSGQVWKITGTIRSQSILSEQTRITIGEKPPTVTVNLPDTVMVGRAYKYEAVVEEPINDDLFMGTVFDNPVSPALLNQNQLKLQLPSIAELLSGRTRKRPISTNINQIIKLSRLPSGGFFKIGTASKVPETRWISAVLARHDGGITIATHRLRTVR